MQARVDIKLAQLHATRARVEAAADGAIQLALADLMLLEVDGEFSGRVVHHGSHSLGGLDVSVSLTPLTGLIDLNQATEELLFRVFSVINDVDETVARELSTNVVKWRSPDPFPGELGSQINEEPRGLAGMTGARHGRFEAIEDLLLVQGVDRRIFEAIRDSVYVDQAGQPGVDWVSAPASVLQALGDMDEEAAMDLAESRLTEKVEGLVAPQGIDLGFQETADLSSYRVDALVVFDGSVFRRRRWVDRARSGADGLPWRFFRTEAVRVLPQIEGSGLVVKEDAHAGN